MISTGDDDYDDVYTSRARPDERRRALANASTGWDFDADFMTTTTGDVGRPRRRPARPEPAPEPPAVVAVGGPRRLALEGQIPGTRSGED